MKVLIGLLAAATVAEGASLKHLVKKPDEPSALDAYVQQALKRGADPALLGVSPGSLWSPGANLADLARDHRANQIDDLVTILVSEQASAVATGTVKTSRASSAKASVNSLAGPQKPTSFLANLADLSGQTQLNGQGSTSRGTTLTATVSARVIAVLPNGYLVVEGVKQVGVDSEHQTVSVRGVVRPEDISTANSVPSNRLADMEVRINGKGVVSDASRRPFFLYRLLTGLLPF